jgi:endonuclease/exonuclease/phosphatase family metal-dependent hydrolase
MSALRPPARSGLTALALCLILIANGSASEPVAPMRVMTFNIRYGAADDGEHSWPHRKALVAETIDGFDPDVLGLQEALPMQIKFLCKALPDYEYVGRSRNHNEADEQCAVFFRRQRFSLKNHGTFWLSETPEVIGSKSWDSSLPRIVTWVELADRERGGVTRIFNTHFDHEGEQARLESARVLRRRIDVLPPLPTIVLGDFNTPDDSAPHDVLTQPGGSPLILHNAYRSIHPQRSPQEATYHGFHGKRLGKPIDWILYSAHFTCQAARLETDAGDDCLASDHFAVSAILSSAQDIGR